MTRPNVLFVVLDTARADHFGPWGGAARTPAFDALAGSGVVAPLAVAAAPWTVPSHASMFSGLPPFVHGVTGGAANAPGGGLASLEPVIGRHAGRWLPELLRRAGYRTFAVSANVWITPQMGFDLGFDEFHSVGMAKIAPRGIPAPAPRGVKRIMPAGIRRIMKGPARQIRDARRGRDFGLRAALAHLRHEARRAGEDAPFFGFVNVMECHAPYLPPAEHNPLRGIERLRAPAAMRRYLMDAHATAYNLGAADVPDRAIAAFRAAYAGSVSYADTFVAGMMAHLRAEGLLGSTLVAVTADHGENLGEAHLLGHQLSLDPRLLHVPLVVAGPGAPHAIPGAWSTAAIPRLIADALELESPWEDSAPIAVSQYEGGRRQIRRAAEAEARYRLTDEQRRRLETPMERATDGATTLTIDERGEHLDGPPEAASGLRAALAATRGDGPDARAAGVSPDQEAEITAHLEELGYL